MNRMSAAEYQRTVVGKEEEPENPYDKSWIPVDVPKGKKLPQVLTLKKLISFKNKLDKAEIPMNNRTMRVGEYEFTNRKVRKHEEDDITEAVTQYLEALQVQGKVVVFSHIPQETFTKSWATKNKNKRMGVRSGVPDMLIVFPEAVLFLELKRIKGGVLSDSQKKWLSALTQVRSKNQSEIYAGVAYGFDDAQSQIDALLD
jgi:hypothetical protein